MIVAPASRAPRRAWHAPGLFLALLLAASSAVAEGANPVAADAEPALRALLDAVRYGEDLGGGLRFYEFERRRRELLFVLGDADLQRLGTLRLLPRGYRGRKIRSFAVQLRMDQGRPAYARPDQARREEAAFRALTAAVQRVDAQDDGSFATLFPDYSGGSPSWWQRFGHEIRLAGLMLAAGFVGVLAWRRRLGVRAEFRLPHLLPTLLQLTLIAYWAFYVEATRERLPLIALQIAFAFALDAFLWVARTGTWRISMAPVPIVLSTNLFVWYTQAWLQLAVIALALCSKALIRWDGRHLFNPAAFGISVAALATTFAPELFPWGSPTTGIQLNLAPNMAELMLLLALVAQLRFPIVLIPLGAVIGLSAAQALAPPSPTWPATFLILLLFSTDPATIPRTSAGRLLYGLLLGVSIAVFAVLFRRASLPDDYAKVLAVLAANALRPVYDWLGPKAMGWWQQATALPARQLLGVAVGLWFAIAVAMRGPFIFVFPMMLLALLPLRYFGATRGIEFVKTFSDERWNRIHVVTWLLLAALMISNSKPRLFEAYGHWRYQTAGIQVDEYGVPTREANPVFIRPFSFLGELRLDRGRE